MRLNLHARIEIGLVAVLLLGSCDGPGLSNKQRDEVGDIAGDVAGDVVTDDEKVRELERRIEAIEQRLNI
jgi:hypothetical protein